MISGGRPCLAQLLGVVLLAACAHTRDAPTAALPGADLTTQATCMLVAWVAEGKRMPGYGLAFCPEQDRARMKECRVLCAYLPAATRLSASPSVKRIHGAYDGPPFSEGGVLAVELELRKRLDNKVIIGLKVLNLSQAAYKTFIFQAADGKIQVRST